MDDINRPPLSPAAWQVDSAASVAKDHGMSPIAVALEAPTLLDRALAGDKQAARKFLHQAGFTDADGNWLPHFQPLETDD